MCLLFILDYDTVQRLQASDYKLSSLTKERDQLNANLTEMTKELNRSKCGAQTFSSAGAAWWKKNLIMACVNL